MLFTNMKIGLRLAAGFAIVILIGLVSALVNNHSLSTANRVAQQIREQNFPYALLAEEMAFHTEAVQQYLTDVGATREPDAFEEAEAAAQAFMQGLAVFKQAYREANDPGALKKLEKIEVDFGRFYEQGRIMAQAYVDEGTAAGNRIMRDFDRNSDIIAAEIREFKTGQRDEASNLLQQLTASLEKTKVLLWLLAASTVITGITVGWLITRSITRPIAEAVSFSKTVAAGDLTQTIEVRGGGEVGDMTASLNAMVRSLNGMFSNIKGSSGKLTLVSNRISDVSTRVNHAVSTQASGVENTSSAISQINSSIKGIMERVDNLAQFSADNSASALEMAASVEEVAQSVGTFADSTEGVSASIMETAAAIRQINGSAATLKETYAKTAVSISQMDNSIRRVEQNARDASSISSDVLRDAETGKTAVEATAAGINEIKRVSTITSEVIANLSARTEQIGDILLVIDDVSEQINLLALNAAIIAAQAGVHGRGFAVVAEEIKSLAMRTSGSTREIGEVIEGVQSETRRAVEAIAKAETSIAEGAHLSQKSAEALTKIVSGMKKASDQVGEIAKATVEQTQGSLKIREAMEQVTEMVDQIARATGEQRKGSELIMDELERMRGLTSQVRSSTREQSNTGSLIAKTTTEIAEMIRQIKWACVEQSKGSEQIVRAVEDIRESTAVNLDAIRVMEEAVSGMSAQVEVLEGEMANFRVS